MTFQGSRAVNRAFTVAVSVKCGCHRLGDDVNFLLAFIFNFRFNQVELDSTRTRMFCSRHSVTSKFKALYSSTTT